MPLSEEGLQQAEQLAAWFADREIARIISSPYTHAVQSVAPLAKRHVGRRDKRWGLVLLCRRWRNHLA